MIGCRHVLVTALWLSLSVSAVNADGKRPLRYKVPPARLRSENGRRLDEESEHPYFGVKHEHFDKYPDDDVPTKAPTTYHEPAHYHDPYEKPEKETKVPKGKKTKTSKSKKGDKYPPVMPPTIEYHPHPVQAKPSPSSDEKPSGHKPSGERPSEPDSEDRPTGQKPVESKDVEEASEDLPPSPTPRLPTPSEDRPPPPTRSEDRPPSRPVESPTPGDRPSRPSAPSPTPDRPSSPTPDRPSSPTPDRPSSPTPDRPSSPTPDRPSSPTPDRPSSPTPDRPSSPTPDRPSSPTPDRPSSPTPDRPSSPTPDRPSSPTPDRPSSPTPDRPSSPTPDRPSSPTPDRPSSPAPVTPDMPSAPAPTQPSPPGTPTPEPTQQPIFQPTPPTAPVVSPTSPPVDPEGRRDLAPWVLHYTTTNSVVPFTRDIAEVVNLTDAFLSDYFFDLFGRVNFATLDDFIVMYMNSEYNRDGPNQIQYSAVAFFAKDSDTIPQPNDLDVLLRQAYVGASLANYTRIVQELPDSNPFSSTTKVAYSNSTTAFKSSVEGSETLSSGKKGAIVAASLGIAAVGVMIGGFIFFKRRHDTDERKSLVHGHFSFGHTVVTADDRTALSLESQPMPPDENLHSLRGQTRSAFMNDEFESLADSSSYTSYVRNAPNRTSDFESMLYDDDLPDDIPFNSDRQPLTESGGAKRRPFGSPAMDGSTSSAASSSSSSSVKSAASSDSSSSSSSDDLPNDQGSRRSRSRGREGAR